MRVTIEKKTDQLNYEDFLGGVTRIVTIAGVKAGTKEQQYDIAIEGDKRVWRPAVTVLKLLVAAWGDDATEWVGRRAMLYGDPTITFGRERVGGIRVSHLSHIAETVTANLTETRGKRKIHTVEPLPDAPAVPTEADVQASTDTETLRSWWKHAHLQPAIKARVDELKAEQDTGADPAEPDLFERGV
jgi:hypothetical protein